MDSEGVRRGSVEVGHERSPQTVFGEVGVRRVPCRARGRWNLYPADAVLNLPSGEPFAWAQAARRDRVGARLVRGRVRAVRRQSGQSVGKCQLEGLARRGACDFDAFYAGRQAAPSEPADALVLSCDGKGVVMRPDALRAATRRQAQDATTKLKTRLSKGEKRNHKRIAEVGAVYDITPVARTAADIMPADDTQRAAATPAPPTSPTNAPTSTTRPRCDKAGRSPPG